MTTDPATPREFPDDLLAVERVVGGDLYVDRVSLLTQVGLMPEPSRA